MFFFDAGCLFGEECAPLALLAFFDVGVEEAFEVFSKEHAVMELTTARVLCNRQGRRHALHSMYAIQNADARLKQLQMAVVDSYLLCAEHLDELRSVFGHAFRQLRQVDWLEAGRVLRTYHLYEQLICFKAVQLVLDFYRFCHPNLRHVTLIHDQTLRTDV